MVSARFRVIGDRLEGTPATAFDAKLDRAIGEQRQRSSR
jgi:hypothetical protein